MADRRIAPASYQPAGSPSRRLALFSVDVCTILSIEAQPDGARTDDD
jgi:hypothetical protein